MYTQYISNSDIYTHLLIQICTYAYLHRFEAAGQSSNSMIHIYICTCINLMCNSQVHTRLFIHIYIYTHIHIYIYTYIYKHMYTHIHIYIYIYTQIRRSRADAPTQQASMHSHIHVYIYTYIHIYIYTYAHIYTYTHIHIYLYTYIHRFDAAGQMRQLNNGRWFTPLHPRVPFIQVSLSGFSIVCFPCCKLHFYIIFNSGQRLLLLFWCVRVFPRCLFISTWVTPLYLRDPTCQVSVRIFRGACACVCVCDM